MPGKYYLTTPLYYVNSKPHIGHSYTEIAADVLARWHRMSGTEVLFLTGTDEHGQKVERAAKEAGMDTQAFTDKISKTFSDLWRELGIEYTDFIRTTEVRHKDAVKQVWLDLDKKGEIYTATYRGYYCTPCETFLSEEVVRQQLETSATVLCPDCKRPAEPIEESNFFFKTSKYQNWLIETIEKNESMVILPDSRRNEVLGFLKNNTLQDLCISRPKSRLSWGIPSPLSKDHVTYVWFDALINYISACGYGDAKKIKNFEKWWPADVHLIGKDILRHHAVYWPILLHALGLKLPKLIFAHGWWLQGGDKMSKSKGNVTDPVELCQKYGVDAYRYFLLAETPFGQDGTFSEDSLILRYNTNLANDLGNLLSRTLTMCEKYFEAMIPASGDLVQGSVIQKEGAALLEKSRTLFRSVEASMKVLAFSEALKSIWLLIDEANKYIEASAPWVLAKQKKDDELRSVIAVLCDVLRSLSTVLKPFMPKTADMIRRQLGLSDEFGVTKMLAGVNIAKGSSLFPRIEVEKKKGL